MINSLAVLPYYEAADLIDAGFQSLEVFSCIHPKVAPAMNEYALRKISRDLGRVWQTKGKQQKFWRRFLN